MRRCAVAIRVEPTSQAVFGFPGPSRPERRIRRILHNIGPFDPDERFITLRSTSSSGRSTSWGGDRVPIDEPVSLTDLHPPGSVGPREPSVPHRSRIR